MYTPTDISGFDVDSGEKVMKAGKIKANLGLISQETKQLADMISDNLAKILADSKRIDDQSTSHAKLFLDLN